MTDCDIEEFDQSYTSIPFYDMMLRNGKNTGRYKDNQFKIECIAPEEYFKEVSRFHQTTSEMEKGATWSSRVDEYKKKTMEGSPMPIPLLDYNSRVAEGRHRAMAAIQLGIKKMPVLVITKYKKY